MAGSGTNDFCGSWLGWLQTAKEKGTAALDMVRKDLAEFGCTMQKDTSHAVEVTSTSLKETLKATGENSSGGTKEKLTKGLNTFLEGISKAIAVPPDDEGQIPITASSVDLYHDRKKARLHALQVDRDTYLREPDGSPEDYSSWCETFDPDAAKGDISELLVSKAEVRALYTKLVPSQVSHVDFWRRYFYKWHQIEVDQARKEDLMKRAERSRTDDDSTLRWEFDWSGDEEGDEDNSSSDDWEPGQTAATPSMSGAAASAPNPQPPPQQKAESGGAAAAVTVTEPSHCPPPASRGSQGVSQNAALQDATSKEETASWNFVDLHPEDDDQPMSTVEETVQSKAYRPSQSEKREEQEQPSSEHHSNAVSSDDGEVEPSPELQHVEEAASAHVVSNVTSPAESPLPVEPGSGEQGSLTKPPNKQVELVSSQNEPVSTQNEPVGSQNEPVGSQNEPVSTQNEPLSSQNEPVSTQNEPVSSQNEPVSTQNEPVSSQNEPVSKENESLSKIAELEGSQSEQTSTKEDIEKSKAEPVTIQNEPVTAGADAVTSEAAAATLTDEGQVEEAEQVMQEMQEAPADPAKATEMTTDPGNLATSAPTGKSDSASALEEDDDDWDQDLDVELTEEDMKAAERLAQALSDGANLEDDDWEKWE